MTSLPWLAAFENTAIRETRQLLRNRQLVFFCFFLPLFWILIVWGLLGDGVMQSLQVAMVDQDNSAQSRAALQAIAACRAVKLVPFQQPDTALAAMKSGETYAVLLVPAGYGRDELKGTGGSLVLWLDENRYAAAGVLSSEMESALRAMKTASAKLQIMRLGLSAAQADRLASVVHDESFVLGNLQSSFLAFLGSTLIPSLIMIGAMFTFVTAFLREWWHQSFGEWIEAAQNMVSAAVFGKLLPYYLAYTLIFLFYLALFAGLGANTPTGPLLAWLCLGLGCLGAFAGSAIIVAAISPTWRMALVISAGYAAPALPFTGFSMPLDSMSIAAAAFGRCLPLTWYIQGQTQAWTLGSHISDMLVPFGGLFCLIVVSWSVGLPLMRWSANIHARKEARA